MTPPRIQTQTERDADSYAAKLKRESEHADKLAVPHEVDDPVTGQYEGPELESKRDERDPKERFKRLEKKADTGEVERAELRAQNAELLQKILDMSGTTFNTNIEIGKASADDELAAKKAKREADEAARKARRELVAKTVLQLLVILGAVLAGKYS